MKSNFNAKLLDCVKYPDRALAFQQLLALQRSCLQMASLAAVDLYKNNVNPIVELELTDLLIQMLSPADGTTIQFLDVLMPSLRSQIGPRFCSGWYPNETTSTGDAINDGLAKRLEGWVSFRNNRPGHGVLDRATIDQEFEPLVSLLKLSIIILEPLLPELVTSKQFKGLALLSQNPNVFIKSCPTNNGDPVVVRSFKCTRGVWSVCCQTLDVETSREITLPIEADAALLTLGGGLRKRRFIGRTSNIGGTEWTTLTDIPSRQTAHFEGRRTELEQLQNWCNDLESRACLLYGDGGIGKTTLVLEFVHNLLERPPDNLLYRPEVICFYSAKMTRWSEHGIQHFSALQPAIEDSVRQLLYAIHDNLDKQWWKYSRTGLIDRVAQEFRNVGVERNAVLLIIDNAETLATRPGDEQILGELLSSIARKVARVVVTSRRREEIEARPIEVEPLEDEAGCALLTRLGKELGASAIISAGDARLRKESKALKGKPLLLEALARHVANTGISIDAAKAQILRDAQDGLSEFLYQDAWARITDEHRRVFIVLSEIEVPITNHVVGWVCSLVGVPSESWLRAFEETHFGSKLEYGGEFEIEIAQMSAEFFRLKGKNISASERAAIDQYKSEVTRKYQDRERAISEPASDRIEEAFRTPEARAAKWSARLGKLDDANLWYEEAITKDSQNSALFDRYAWFLMQLHADLEKAGKMSDVACRIDPKNAEAHFTKALVLYRRYDIVNGDRAIDVSLKLGKPELVCLLQKARARMSNVNQPGVKLEQRSKYLEQVETLLNRAQESFIKGKSDRYYPKNRELFQKLETWLGREMNKGRLIRKGGYIG